MSKDSSKENMSKQGPLGPKERWSARRKNVNSYPNCFNGSSQKTCKY